MARQEDTSLVKNLLNSTPKQGAANEQVQDCVLLVSNVAEVKSSAVKLPSVSPSRDDLSAAQDKDMRCLDTSPARLMSLRNLSAAQDKDMRCLNTSPTQLMSLRNLARLVSERQGRKPTPQRDDHSYTVSTVPGNLGARLILRDGTSNLPIVRRSSKNVARIMSGQKRARATMSAREEANRVTTPSRIDIRRI